jgi:hypothetical protein
MKRLLVLLLLPGCYDRNTRLIDAWYPGGRDAAVVDARVLPPDAFGGPDAFAPPDAFVWPDANISAADEAIARGCDGAEPNVYAVSASPRDGIWRGVNRVQAVVWNAVDRAPTRLQLQFGAGGDGFLFQSLVPMEIGTFPMVESYSIGSIGFDARVDVRGCAGTDHGTVIIHEMTTVPPRYDPHTIVSFRASFEQHCRFPADTAEPATVLRGCIRYTAR